MYTNKIAVLKAKLVNAEKFTDIWEYFFDHLGEDPEFINLGSRVEDEMLFEVVKTVAGQFMKGEINITQRLLTAVPEYQFIHGTVFTNGVLTPIMYFQDLQMGCLAGQLDPKSTDMQYCRFTGRPAPKFAQPSVN